jgi:hypothetical protein
MERKPLVLLADLDRPTGLCPGDIMVVMKDDHTVTFNRPAKLTTLYGGRDLQLTGTGDNKFFWHFHPKRLPFDQWTALLTDLLAIAGVYIESIHVDDSKAQFLIVQVGNKLIDDNTYNLYTKGCRTLFTFCIYLQKPPVEITPGDFRFV